MMSALNKLVMEEICGGSVAIVAFERSQALLGDFMKSPGYFLKSPRHFIKPGHLMNSPVYFIKSPDYFMKSPCIS